MADAERGDLLMRLLVALLGDCIARFEITDD